MEEGVNEIHEYLSVEKRDFKEPNMTVADLMILNEKRWNVPFIREFFDADSEEKLLHTPLLNSIREDKVIWRLENNGMYSVKSAYRYCVEEVIDTTGLHEASKWTI
jgi:hypothetical protein